MQTNKQTNAMVRHNNLYHLSQQVDYQMSVVSTHREPLGRQLREGVEIVGGQQDILLNSKEEFLQGAVPSSRTQNRRSRYFQIKIDQIITNKNRQRHEKTTKFTSRSVSISTSTSTTPISTA